MSRSLDTDKAQGFMYLCIWDYGFRRFVKDFASGHEHGTIDTLKTTDFTVDGIDNFHGNICKIVRVLLDARSCLG